MPISLENDALKLVLEPEAGASVLALLARRGDGWLELMPDVGQPSCDLRHASFIMAPYSNRIEDGLFRYGGHLHQLERAHEHAIHGDVRTRPWDIVQKTPTALSCTWDSQRHSRVNWPWSFSMRARYRLDAAAVTWELGLTNTSDEPFPAGFGWHPYFSRALTRSGEPVKLQLPVQGAYPDANDNRIPSGPPQPLEAHQDFRLERDLAPLNFLDTCMVGYTGGGSISWPESGICIHLDCSRACSHLVMYNPDGKPYFAVEPVTNANNGVNMLGIADADSGVSVLLPGESLEASFCLAVQHDSVG
jgi:aldose 1-epimerase